MSAADLGRDRAVPIGTAASGTVISLDPPGEGEIVVTGPTVMAGYWGADAQEGPYRTGDLARCDDAGQLDYVGRRNGMVKVRGHRIEITMSSRHCSAIPRSPPRP